MNRLVDLSARLVIAHRGASGDAPENTLPAFELAVESGADALELDVRLSGDGVPVVIHDPLLDRTTDRTGPVAAMAAAELQRADAGARFTPDRGRTFPFRGAGIGIPTLADVVRGFPDLPLLIEVKEAAAQHAVRRVLLEERAAERVVVASPIHDALLAFREPPFAAAASQREIGELYRVVLLRRPLPTPGYRLLSVPCRYHGLPVATRPFIAAARRLGCPVHVWTVDDPAAARRLWARGVGGIVTNVPRLMCRVRATGSPEAGPHPPPDTNAEPPRR